MKSRLLSVVLVISLVANVAIAVAAYQIGQRVQKTRHDRSIYYVQASLAFAHHGSYGSIADYLERECYDAALSEAKEMRDAQVALLAENLRRTENDPTLLEYIRLRDPKLLASVLAGQMPELPSPEHPLTLICPEPPNGHDVPSGQSAHGRDR